MSVSSERVCEIQQNSWGSGGAFGFSQRGIKFSGFARARHATSTQQGSIQRYSSRSVFFVMGRKSRYEVVESF